MEKNCGFCRGPGHTKSKCSQLKAELNAIRIHVPAERKAIHDILLANGYGTGAIVNIREWGGDEKMPAVIPTMNFFSTNHRFDLIDLRKVKYNARDKVTLHSFSGNNFAAPYIPEAPKNEILIRYLESVKIPAYHLHDMSRTVYATVVFSDLLNVPDTRQKSLSNYRWEETSELLSPSQDTDLELDLLLQNVRVSQRLLLKDQLDMMDGIKSW